MTIPVRPYAPFREFNVSSYNLPASRTKSTPKKVVIIMQMAKNMDTRKAAFNATLVPVSKRRKIRIEFLTIASIG